MEILGLNPQKRRLTRREKAQRGSSLFLAVASILIPAITLLSFLPGSSKAKLHTHGRYHSWGHLLIFCVIGFVMTRAARTERMRMWLFVAAMLFGFGIEIAEHFVFKSPLEWKDVFMDVTGVVGGTLMALATEAAATAESR